MYSAWDKTNLELNMIYCTSSQTFITQDHIILKNLLQILNHSLCGFCIVIFIILKIKAENVYLLLNDKPVAYYHKQCIFYEIYLMFLKQNTFNEEICTVFDHFLCFNIWFKRRYLDSHICFFMFLHNKLCSGWKF